MLNRRIAAGIAMIAALIGGFPMGARAEAHTKTKKATIVFTHDLHSRMDDEELGGFSRLKTGIDGIRQEKQGKEGVFVLDGGDFSMGTLYQTLFEKEASELLMLGYLGYDATTLGNHEFDYRSRGLAAMLATAKEKATENQTVLPQLVISNINWKENRSGEDKQLKKAMEEFGSKSYTIIEKEGVRIGIFGVLGEDADASAPESGLTFQSITESSKKMVQKLQQEKVDMIVCLSHSGTNPDPKKSEDEILAKEVPQIDVIISGHTHTRLEKPIRIQDTYIVSAGEYGQSLGELALVQTKEGRWEAADYQLHAMDDTVPSDEGVKEKLKAYEEAVNREYLAQFGYRFDEVVAQNQVDFTPFYRFGEKVEEDTLGSLIADSYIYTVKDVEKEAYEPVAVSLIPAGVVRGSVPTGDVTTADIFNISSLGIGADRVPGYPLVSVYLTGKELKTVAEIDVSVSPLMPSAQLYGSGLHWTYNNNRMPLNRVTEVALADDVFGGKADVLEEEKLYRVVAGLYSAQMLGAVEDVSKGILKVQPKDKNGKPIKDFEKYILHTPEGQEVKEWWALANYMKSFEKNESGLPSVSEKYSRLEGRKTQETGKNPADILKHPNRIALTVYGIGILILGILLMILGKIIKRWRKKGK